jgi:hypothetical protein
MPGSLTHKKVIGVRNVTTNPEEFHKVVELAVNVAAYLEPILETVVRISVLQHHPIP